MAAGTSKLDRYRYVRTLGSGGMGIVSLAEDTLLARSVALKRVSALGGDHGPLRLRREALLGASVSHPNLVSIYDVVDPEDGDLVIVMEYVEGETLRERMAARGRLETGETMRILAGAAAGLDAIHQQGIVHRDVKPANILLGTDGAVKVADLGIASVADQTRLTASGSLLGSLSYMAPEQLSEEPATPAIDVYALAAVAYEALSGAKARKEANAVALAYAISSQPAPALDTAWPTAPPEAVAVLSAAMAKDPTERPDSAGELVARLQAALEPERPPLQPERTAPEPEGTVGLAVAPEPTPARRAAAAAPRTGGGHPASPKPRRPRSGWWALAPLLAVAAVALVAVTALGGGGGQPRTRARAGQTSAAAGTHTTRAAAGVASSSTRAASSSRAPGASVSAVESFYGLAAAHRYADAWALTDPTFRSQLQGYQSFQNSMSADRSITFDATRVVSQSAQAATVYIKTTSVRADGTKHCAGTVSLRPGGTSTRWLLHLIQISCA